jgi:hypothetical protein
MSERRYTDFVPGWARRGVTLPEEPAILAGGHFFQKKEKMENINFDPKLTEDELSEIQFALDNLTEDHQDSVEKWIKSELVDDDGDTEKAKKDLINRYANEIGGHEVADRTFLAMEHFEDYIRNHPVVIMDEKAFRLASIVTQLMHEIYQVVACKYAWPEDKKDETAD